MSRFARLVLGKTAAVLAVSAAGCLLVGLFSNGGVLFAGFTAGLIGAGCLLNAWAKYLRATGRRAFPPLRQPRPPGAPYFHRPEKEIKRSYTLGRFPFDDGLEDETADELEDRLPWPERLKASAAAYAVCGVVMLGVSLVVY